jgi:hypothetical protein
MYMQPANAAGVGFSQAFSLILVNIFYKFHAVEFHASLG